MKTTNPEIPAPLSIKIIAFQNEFSFSVEESNLTHDNGLMLSRYTFRFGRSVVPEPILLEWEVPVVDMVGKWYPDAGTNRSLTANWVQYLNSYATLNAPVMSLFSAQGENRHCFALSDAVNPLKIQAQVNEETATVRCRVILFDAPTPEMDTYEIILRRDKRKIGYAQALSEVAQWWADMEAYQPETVPASALEPVYSTWYSYHQQLSPEVIEEECRWARGLGCGTVILDDGWQTDDENKGYAFCGDWEIATSKFPDFAGHVKRIQNMGMNYMIWYSVPYAGLKSETWKRFQNRVLSKPFRNAACLDPRFQEVRTYLIACYERAVKEWGVDGLKLDFVDQFTAELPGSDVDEKPDMLSVPAAADRLLTDVMVSLKQIHPDILIEFRQKYIGPAMRKYGNLFRAQDCPNDALSNRVRTLDVRLLAGNTAVHSDMIMWHPEEKPEQVAHQLWATLFSVPQISVRKSVIMQEQEKTLRFYLGFWKEHRDLLLHGKLNPQYPQDLYPVVSTQNDKDTLVVGYADRVLRVDGMSESSERLILVNGGHESRLVVDFVSETEIKEMQLFNCQGDEIESERVTPVSLNGIQVLSVPASGVAICRL
ncbi:alpha-galactosidase [Kiritimatiellaeota bacterium B1221]|nr:alpha-galactosidase [Kiritimatiellaeota bacterium B1221]